MSYLDIHIYITHSDVHVLFGCTVYILVCITHLDVHVSFV